MKAGAGQCPAACANLWPCTVSWRSAMEATRVGEASNPGPLEFDDPESEIWQLEEDSHMWAQGIQNRCWDEPPHDNDVDEVITSDTS
eukprot:4787898-Karenia_brevis.AAC.1